MYGIIRILIIIIILFLIINDANATRFQDEVIKQSAKYTYVREVTQNRSPEIDMFNRWMGMPMGVPWCLVYTLYCNNLAAQELGISNPYPKIARVYLFNKAMKDNPIRYKYISLQQALITGEVQKGDIILWRHGPENTNWNGHAGIALGYKGFSKSIVSSRQGNTTSTGSSRESLKGGDGVYDKPVDLKNMGSLKVIGFARARYVK